MSFQNSSIENIDSSNRGSIELSGNPTLNEEVVIVTANSQNAGETKSDSIIPFCDSCTDLVTIVRKTSQSKKYGYFSDTDNRLNRTISDNAYLGNVSQIQLSLDLINNISFVYPIVWDLNSYEVEKLGSIISPFEIYDEIRRTNVYDRKYKGFKCDIGNVGSKDLRNRNINLKDNIDKNNKNIEEYDDTSEDMLILTSFRKRLYREGNFLKLTSDSEGTVTITIDSTKDRFKTVTSNESIFLSKEDNLIKSFVDREYKIENSSNLLQNKENRNYITNQTFSNFADQRYLNNKKDLYTIFNNSIKTNETKYLSRGFDNNYLENSGIESIAFRGFLE